LQAILVNRVGDWAFLIGLFGLFWLFGTLEYSTLFSIAPMIHEALFTLIALGLLIGAMAKSAQIGLHTWLPNAMEGSRILLPALLRIFQFLSVNKNRTAEQEKNWERI